MRSIITVPNPILTTRAKKILDINQNITDLSEEMKSITRAAKGIGLAATQIGSGKQIAYIEISENDNVFSDIIINPRILHTSKENIKDWEGCLSIPNIEVEVSRPKTITVEYQNINNKKEKITVEGLVARAFQHEIDHLNGILITDYGPAKQIKKN